MTPRHQDVHVAGSLGQVTYPVGGLEVGGQYLDALAELRTKRLERLDVPSVRLDQRPSPDQHARDFAAEIARGPCERCGCTVEVHESGEPVPSLAVPQPTRRHRPRAAPLGMVGPVRTAVTELLGIEHPILQAPMASVSTPELAAAVSEAGGLGALGSAILAPDELGPQAAAVRKRTGGPFQLNFFCHKHPEFSAAAGVAARDR